MDPCQIRAEGVHSAPALPGRPPESGESQRHLAATQPKILRVLRRLRSVVQVCDTNLAVGLIEGSPPLWKNFKIGAAMDQLL